MARHFWLDSQGMMLDIVQKLLLTAKNIPQVGSNIGSEIDGLQVRRSANHNQNALIIIEIDRNILR